MAIPLHSTNPQEVIPTVMAVSKFHPGPKDIEHLIYSEEGNWAEDAGAL